ncbi:MAG: alpha-L-arabinofuranosidase [Paenibacillus sp.]|nr:alpha-L-arabinofuranosidase [Paenibacillus sp.]
MKHNTSIQIALLEDAGPVAPASIMGVNLEMIKDASAGLVSDGLDNSKFCGPADGLTGLAPGWHPITHNMGGMHCRLVPGMSLSGGESQLVHVYGGATGRGIVQKGIGLKENEELEVELWAKVRHHPVTLQLSFGSTIRSVQYDAAEVTIDSAYWKPYKVKLRAKREDRSAIFMITFVTNGQVLFDQVHVRPVGASHISKELMDVLKELRLPNVRFPGGSVTACYYWRNGTGPVHLRPSLPDPCFKWRVDYEFGMEEYMRMCQEQQMQPFITVNIGSATPEEIGEQAAYCADWYRRQGLEPPVAFFNVGSEHHGAWEPSHMTAEMYVEALRVFVPIIRANYPNPRIVVMGYPESVGVDGPNTQLRQAVLQDAQGLFDTILLHIYSGGWSDDPQEWAAKAAAGAIATGKRMRNLLEDCRAAGSDAKIALTEWGFRNEAMHWDGKGFFEPDDAAHGIYFAGMIHMLAGLAPDIEVANYYHLVNAMGMVRNDGGFVSGTGVSELYKLYRTAFPGQVLPLSVQSPQFDNGVAQADALAVRAADTMYVFVSNRSTDQAMRVRLDGWQGDVAAAVMLSAEEMGAPFRPAEPPRRDGQDVELPPLSVVRLEVAL